MPGLYLLTSNLTHECEDFSFFRGIVRLAEIVYTKYTTFVTFPSGDNLGRYEVRIFPSVVRAAIGIRKLCICTPAENMYDASSPPLT